MKPNTKIEFTCNPGAYSGEDVQSFCPDFMHNYNLTVGYKWRPSAEGPENWALIVQIGAAASAIVGTVFLKKLAEDLYAWTKSKILPTLQTKNIPNGQITLKFENTSIWFTNESADLDTLKIFSELPNLLVKIDPELCELWTLDVVESKVILEPNFSSVMLKLYGGDSDDIKRSKVHQIIKEWHNKNA